MRGHRISIASFFLLSALWFQRNDASEFENVETIHIQQHVDNNDPPPPILVETAERFHEQRENEIQENIQAPQQILPDPNVLHRETELNDDIQRVEQRQYPEHADSQQQHSSGEQNQLPEQPPHDQRDLPQPEKLPNVDIQTEQQQQIHPPDLEHSPEPDHTDPQEKKNDENSGLINLESQELHSNQQDEKEPVLDDIQQNVEDNGSFRQEEVDDSDEKNREEIQGNDSDGILNDDLSTISSFPAKPLQNLLDNLERDDDFGSLPHGEVLLNNSNSEEDDRTFLDMFGEAAKVFLTQRLVSI